MNTEKVIDQLRTVVWAAEENQRLADDPYLQKNRDLLRGNLQALSDSFCGSWIGYHASVYYAGFRRPATSDHFSSEWGLTDDFMAPTSDNWGERTPEEVQVAAFRGVDAHFRAKFTEVSERAAQAYDDAKNRYESVVAILMEGLPTDAIRAMSKQFSELAGCQTEAGIINALRPRGFSTRDSLAASQGMRIPAHIRLVAWLEATASPFAALRELANCARQTLGYLELRAEFQMPARNASGKKVFIGHGRSPLWRELKDFLSDRLHLPWEEFNREPVAGLTTVERLTGMLENASCAFLIMTAEDEHADSTLHARDNVIHEIGLFQGRLGFRRAIVVLEHGCSEFSNIIGLSQIRFAKGNISACFEEVRRVLEREGLFR